MGSEEIAGSGRLELQACNRERKSKARMKDEKENAKCHGAFAWSNRSTPLSLSPYLRLRAPISRSERSLSPNIACSLSSRFDGHKSRWPVVWPLTLSVLVLAQYLNDRFWESFFFFFNTHFNTFIVHVLFCPGW